MGRPAFFRLLAGGFLEALSFRVLVIDGCVHMGL